MDTQKITKQLIQQIYRPVDSKAHKGTQGHALIIGGSYGKIGAVSLASKAALRTGCGLVTTFIPECGYDAIQAAIPEVMVVADSESKIISNIQYEFIPDAIGIGPGIGQDPKTQTAFSEYLHANKVPLVIDADALNILSKNAELLSFVKPNTILTPHPKELERLIGTWDSDQQKFTKTQQFSIEQNVIIVSKGAPTQIFAGENVYENTTGNQALATAGSGDVLTGMITSLIAQSYEPLHAALIAVYLHGMTADIALPETGHESFIASDIIANVGKALLTLDKNRTAIGFK